MSEAPEIIWVENKEEIGGGVAAYYIEPAYDPNVTPYVRADLREDLQTENDRLREALMEIAAVKHPSEPPNPYKQIARAALGKEESDE